MSDLNAFLYRNEDAQGGEGLLAGISVGVKANIMVAGMPFHAGIGSWADRRATRDAEVVARLRAAGARVVGILNMEEAALGSKTDNPHFGPTHNPHRHGWSPGGSSGGSGAAVAAGECDVALGTDTMGSVRIPAAHCGVYGFKPANDAVSQDGLERAEPSLDVIGPLARDLDTLQRVAQAMGAVSNGIDDHTGAILLDHGVELHPDVALAFEAVLAALPRPPAPVRLEHPNSRIRYAGFIKVSRYLAGELADVAVSPRLAKLLSYGPRRPTPDWAEDQAVLAATALQMEQIVAVHGWLIAPTVPNPAFPLSEAEPVAQADFTCLANVAGLPALSLPMGWTADGLPVGVQIIGRKGCDAGLFALARHLDAKLGAYRAPSQGA